MEVAALFPESYTESRQRFRGNLARVLSRWPQARLASFPLSIPGEELALDWIEAPAEQPQKLLIITLGEHGVEAFAGAAMLALFLDEFLDRLDPARTSLLLIHAINPWGMQHGRRVNIANVDLNRNFVANDRDLDPASNPEYHWLTGLLNPEGPVGSGGGFWVRLARALTAHGAVTLRRAMLLGQYHTPHGIYYGGDAIQPEVAQVAALYRRWIPAHPRVAHLDMHTGYGPRWQMSVVASPLEARSSAQMARDFGYPRVVKADPNEFYSMQGDMIDYVYGLAHRETPGSHVFAASFEFGTFGDSLPASIRSLKALVEENQLVRFGAATPVSRQRVTREFAELFNPADSAWRSKAIADARQAFEGILKGEGFIR